MLAMGTHNGALYTLDTVTCQELNTLLALLSVNDVMGVCDMLTMMEFYLWHISMLFISLIKKVVVAIRNVRRMPLENALKQEFLKALKAGLQIC